MVQEQSDPYEVTWDEHQKYVSFVASQISSVLGQLQCADSGPSAGS